MIYEKVKRLADLLNVKKNKSRICIFQRNLQNVSYQNTQEFCWKTVFIPHLENIHSSLKERFILYKEMIIFLKYVLPNMIVENLYSNFKTAVTIYRVI